MKSLIKISKLLGAFIMSSFVFVFPLMANEAATTACVDQNAWVKVVVAGATIALASIGGTLGQAKAAAVALEAIGRNPSAQNKIFVPLIVSLALLESLVIYALVVIFAKM
jgi:F-type H+-transporting ATPase subunit c